MTFNPGTCALALILAATGVACAESDRDTATHQTSPNEQARAEFVDREGNPLGQALLTDGPNGLLIYLELTGLPPGPKAIHIHDTGTCDDPEEGFVASGGHLNPDGRKHGLMNPEGPDAGDLPNLIVHEDGSVQVEMFSMLASLSGRGGRAAIFNDSGAALVIHQNRDDHYSQPIGGAGPRIACGVIQPAE